MTGRIEANGDQASLDKEKSVIKGKYKTFSGETLKSIDDLFIYSMSAPGPLSHTFFSLSNPASRERAMKERDILKKGR